MFRPPNRPPPFTQHHYPPPPMQQRVPGPHPPNQNGLSGLLSRFTNSSIPTGEGASKLTNTLSNVQKVLDVAQQATPLIKEYGPLIKDAPKYISMLKALQEINKEEEQEDAEEVEEDSNTPKTEKKEEHHIEESEPIPKGSQPKLFI